MLSWSRFSASKGMQERSESKETRMAMSLLVIMVQGSDHIAVDVQGILDGTDVLTPLVECPGTASFVHAEAKAIYLTVNSQHLRYPNFRCFHYRRPDCVAGVCMRCRTIIILSVSFGS